MNSRKRYLIVMVFCVLLNEVCYVAASTLGWPFWLDMTGTALAALVLEPTAGLLVGLVNNLFLSVFKFDASSMVYYSLSAAAALIAGLGMRKNGRLQVSRIPLVMAAILVVTTILGGSLTLWRGGVSDAYVEQLYYNRLLNVGVTPVLATYLTTGWIKVYDVLVSSVLCGIGYVLMPKRLKGRMEDLPQTIE